MIKLIAIDLDGTLLNNNRIIPDENVRVIKHLVNAGLEIVIATGRRYYSAKKLTEQLGGHFTILANNGNIVRRTDDDELLISKYLDAEAYRDILNEADILKLKGIIHVDMFNQGIDIVLEYDGVDNSHMKIVTEGDKRFRIAPKEELLRLDRVLAVVYPGDKKRLSEFYSIINSKYPGRYNSHVLENIRIAEAMYEAMNPLGSKWKTLLEYAQLKGIKKDEILAIGDDNNDVEMILNAGIGIAMKNGSDLVKSAADIITEKDNDEAGVAFMLRNVLSSFM